MIKKLIVLLLSLVIAGCSVGNTSNYENSTNDDLQSKEVSTEQLAIETPKFESVKDADRYLLDISQKKSFYEIKEFENILANEHYVSSDEFKKYKDLCFYNDCKGLEIQQIRNETARVFMYEQRVDDKWVTMYEAEWISEDDTYKLVTVKVR